MFPQRIEEQAAEVIALYTRLRLLAATAESCTGGLIAAALTEIAGSSAVVDRGFVTYSNQAKIDMLGVSPATLDEHGAVSRQTAVEMATGALAHSRAFAAVAVTGIAGPGGGTAQKPVGLVHLAARSRGGWLAHREMHYGDLGRQGIRLATLATALELLLQAAGNESGAE